MSARIITAPVASGTMGPMKVKNWLALSKTGTQKPGRVPGARPWTVESIHAAKRSSEGTTGARARARARRLSARTRSQRTPKSKRSCANASACQRWSAQASAPSATPRRQVGAVSQRTERASPSTSSGVEVAKTKKPPMTQYESTRGKTRSTAHRSRPRTRSRYSDAAGSPAA